MLTIWPRAITGNCSPSPCKVNATVIPSPASVTWLVDYYEMERTRSRFVNGKLSRKYVPIPRAVLAAGRLLQCVQ